MDIRMSSYGVLKMDADSLSTHEHGCPWSARACANAAVKGLLDIIQLCQANGCNWNEKLVRMQPKYHCHHLEEDAVAKDDLDHWDKEPIPICTPKSTTI
jgi:hypothetical protein